MTESEAHITVRFSCLAIMTAQFLGNDTAPMVRIIHNCPTHTQEFLDYFKSGLRECGIPEALLDDAEAAAQELITNHRAELTRALKLQNALEARQARHQRN